MSIDAGDKVSVGCASKESDYNPQPLDVSGVVLPVELNELIEDLAQNVHDTWAHGRFRQGWRWGAERNDDRKENPCLIPYDQLPDGEKEYDRATATATLKVISKMGFRIVKG